jgi:hypothetical protein
MHTADAGSALESAGRPIQQQEQGTTRQVSRPLSLPTYGHLDRILLRPAHSSHRPTGRPLSICCGVAVSVPRSAGTRMYVDSIHVNCQRPAPPRHTPRGGRTPAPALSYLLPPLPPASQHAGFGAKNSKKKHRRRPTCGR